MQDSSVVKQLKLLYPYCAFPDVVQYRTIFCGCWAVLKFHTMIYHRQNV